MNFSLFVSKRYLFTKESNNFIHLISLISLIGVAIGTTALVLILSIFNGFEDLVLNMYNSFDSDLEITSVTGKDFLKEDVINVLNMNQDILFHHSLILEEKALLKYKNKEYIAVLKGVDQSYKEMMRFDSFLLQGKYLDEFNSKEVAILGNGIAYHLSSVIGSIFDPIEIYIPNRKSEHLLTPNTSFLTSTILPVGVFSIQADIDNTYIITNLEYIHDLLNKHDFVSSVEIDCPNLNDIDLLQEQLKKQLGAGYIIKNRIEQQAFLYRILNSEKLIVFIILVFIMIIAAFNIVGSLSMTILDKKNQIITLSNLGARIKEIQNIFFFKSIFTVLLGAIIGLFIGLLLSYLQIWFGFIKMEGNFVVEYYPVSIHFMDLVLILVTVMFIGVLVSWYPSKHLIRKLLKY